MGRSDFMFAMPSFLRGLASALDIRATLFMFNESQTPEEADSRATMEDWYAIGNDIRGALTTYEQTR